MKQCKKCEQWKDVGEFRAQKRQCRACENAQSRTSRRAKHAKQVAIEGRVVRSWTRSNAQDVAEYNRQWNEKNKEHVLAYRAAHLADHVVYEQHHRARKKGLVGTFTLDQWRAMCAWFGGACLACKTSDVLTVDHVVPVSKGGSNDIRNLQPLCAVCNTRKGRRSTDYRDPDLLQAFLIAIGVSNGI